MKKRMFFGLVIVIALLVVITGVGLSQGTQEEQSETGISTLLPDNLPWYITWVDKTTSTDVGTYPSIAYSPIDGLPYISYYDAENGNLMLASPKAGGNCGTNNEWWCRVVDGDLSHGSADVGKYSSIAFYGTALNWKLGISYYDQTNRSLKYAVWKQVLLNPGSWEIITVKGSGAFSNVGSHTSLKFGSDGVAHISYYQSNTYTNNNLGYAHYVGSGGNCGVDAAVGKWQCDSVDNSDKIVGKYTSIGLDASNRPRIAYYDETNGNLKFAYYTGSNWMTIPVDAFSDDSGKFASLQVSATAPIWRIAYYNATAGKLKYAYYLGDGGDCGLSSITLKWEWKCVDIDSMGAGLAQAGIALGTDPDGNPIIAYEDAAEDLAPSKLNIARPANTVGLLVGNCGPIPQGGFFQTWQCSTIDNASYGLGYVNLAAHTAIALDPSGMAAIAYSETDDYYLRTNLKVTYQYQKVQVFLPLLLR
jgi:hypothetical protein